jgi:hypothetical protein
MRRLDTLYTRRWLIMSASVLLLAAAGGLAVRRMALPLMEPAPASAVSKQQGLTSDRIDVCGIANFAWTIEPILARSAQPPVTAWTCLRDQGFTTVMRQNPEGDIGLEGQLVAASGMHYIEDYAIADQTAYSPAQLEAMLHDVVTRLRAGEHILVHDAGGRGRIGWWETAFLLWDGWPAREAMERYIRLGWKIECSKGGNGQMQAINEVAIALGQPPYYPQRDSYGTAWMDCPRPHYMAGWDYATIRWPAGGGAGWSRSGITQ